MPGEAGATDLEDVVRPEAAPEVVEFVPFPADDVAVGSGEHGTSVDTPGCESTRPDGRHPLARCRGDKDQVFVGVRDSNRREEGGVTSEGQARALRGDVEASRARRQCWTDQQGREAQRDGGEDDQAGRDDRDDYCPE